MNVALILAGALLTIGSCWAAGRLIFRSVSLPSELTGAIQFSTGAGILSLIIFAMCALNIISVPAMTVLGVVLLLTLRPAVTSLNPTLWLIPLAAFSVFYFVNALAPEISADGSFYHLAFPARYLRHGGFFKVSTNFYGNLSQGLEMLFLMAFAIGKHSAAALTHFAFLFVLASGVVAYGTYTGRPTAGWLAALIVFTSPVIAMDATLAYNDVALAAILFSLFFALMRWEDERTTNWLIVAGLLAGFAYAIKYTAAIATPYAIGFVLWRSRSFKKALPLAACATLMIAPWMVKNWIWLDNPVSPFFNRIFPNPYVTVAFEDEYRNNLRHFNGADLNWRIPLDLTITGNKVQGNLGPAFLLLPLALAGLRTREVRRLLFAGLLFAVPWFANLGTRFLIPSAPFFALAIAITVSQWKWAVPVFAVAQSVASWPSIVGLYCEQYNWRLVDFPLAAALRQIPEADFISPRIDTYAIAKMVDRNTKLGDLIYTALPLPEAYSERTYILSYTGALNQSLQEMLATPFLTDFQPTVRITFRPNTQNAQAFRIVQKGACGGPWSMSEVRWTPDRPATFLAHPEPWNARWAHDGNPATRWKIWQRPEPQMYWQAQFSQSGPVETVEIDASPDQSNTCVELQVRTAIGWQTTAQTPEIQAIPLPADIRHSIIDEFHNQGVTHILIHKDERSAADFDARQADWSITKIAESGPARLYRIDDQRQNIWKK